MKKNTGSRGVKGRELLNSAPDRIAGYIDEISSEILKFREHLHANPELSGEEAETAKFILSNIASKENKHIKIYKFEDTFGFWVDVIFKNDNYASGVIAFRADIDALPVVEENVCGYRSKIPGKMHACGHDVHTAALYGAFRSIIYNYDFFKERINYSALRFIFQASEEKSPGGAVPLIAHGVMKGVEMAFGLHVMPNLPSGSAGLMAGAVMAAVDEFELELTGRGGHGAKPDESDDLVLLAAEIIVSAQKIVSRKINPFEPAVVSFCTINSGSARNILPARAGLSGTLRSMSAPVRAALKKKLEHIIKSKCAEFGANYNIKFIEGYPVTFNDKNAVEIFARACAAILGPDKLLHEIERSMGSEDFSYYAQKAPSAFAFFGCGRGGSDENYPLHHPRFNVADNDIINAAKIFAALSLNFCAFIN